MYVQNCVTKYYFIILDCEKLIRHMLVVEPERRLNISQILTHSWMCGNGVVELEPGGYVLNYYVTHEHYIYSMF